MSSAEESPRKIRTFIYGSCVSRDTFEFLPADQFELVGYTARQSLISAFSPGPDEAISASDLTGFRRRVLIDDARSSIASDLPTMSSMIDLLLLDLTDERLGVYTDDAGGILTRSFEGISSGIDKHIAKEMRHIPFASREHYSRWCRAADAFGELLRETQLFDRTVLVRVPWAAEQDDGSPSPRSFGLSAVHANREYQRYFRCLESRVGIAALPTDYPVLADSRHKWGPAPFHYEATTYQRQAASIVQFIDHSGRGS